MLYLLRLEDDAFGGTSIIRLVERNTIFDDYLRNISEEDDFIDSNTLLIQISQASRIYIKNVYAPEVPDIDLSVTWHGNADTIGQILDAAQSMGAIYE